MKRFVSTFAAVALVVACFVPAMAGEAVKDVKLTGYITDEWCGKANANEQGKDCTIACAKKGAALVLFSDGKAYKLSDQKAAMTHVGHEVVVSGSLDSDGTVKVSSIEKAVKKA
jgi:hypothetical protein